jgi:hypothetical protein
MPRLVFRAGLVPLPIKLAVGLGLAFQILAARTLTPTIAELLAGVGAAPLAWGLWLLLSAWATTATLRLSRWPLVTLTAVALAGLAWLAPMFTVGLGSGSGAVSGAFLATWLLFLGLVAPYWRRLNWRLLGRLPTPSDVAEHFS